jgi:hypothetical protein
MPEARLVLSKDVSLEELTETDLIPQSDAAHAQEQSSA